MRYEDLSPDQKQRINQLRRMTPKEWDAICKKCGACCLFKIIPPSNRLFYTNCSCEHMDLKSHTCRVYQDRFPVQKADCSPVTVDAILDEEKLPSSCGYVEYVFGPAKYPVKIDWSEVRPMTAKDFEAITDDKKMYMMIPKSWKWNSR